MEIKESFIVLIYGLLLGSIFFTGLWWTVQIMPKTKSPALLFIMSFILRMTILIAAFFLITNYSHQKLWSDLVICLIGFIIGRFVVSKVVMIRGELNYGT